MRRILLVWVGGLLGLSALSRATETPDALPGDAQVVKETVKTMSGELSPTGQKHPGTIEHIDRVDNRTWTRSAAEVPPSIAWVQGADGAYAPVVRIEITGTPTQRCFTKFGPDGALLETTIQAPPPPRPPR